MTQYASTTDLVTYGLPATALGTLTAGQQNAALERASEEVDSYLRGRYALPLVSWGSDIVEVTVRLATWRLLCLRGFNPNAAADQAVRKSYDDAMVWLRRVQAQQAHPNVTPASSQVPKFNQPTVVSSSVVDVAGDTVRQNRGW